MKPYVNYSLLLLLGIVFSLSSKAQETTLVNGIYYEFNDETKTASVVWGEGYSGEINIPSIVNGYPVTSIGDYVFTGSPITSVTIPNSVTSIGERPFGGCTALVSVSMSNSVTSIGNFAFDGCTALTSIALPNSVKSLGRNVFMGCTALTSITIPESVESIGDAAFMGCTALTSMSVEEGNAFYDSRENCNAIIRKSDNTLITGCQSTIIPKSVTSIGPCAFEGCIALTSINIPDAVTSIGRMAFRGCSALTSVTIGGAVTTIDADAFGSCSALTSVTIGSSVTEIGIGAFEYCTALTHVTCEAVNPPALGVEAFQSIPENATLYVPDGSVAAYSADEKWSVFNRILPLNELPTSIEAVKTDTDNSAVYNLSGQRMSNSGRGIFIKNGKKLIFK